MKVAIQKFSVSPYIINLIGTFCDAEFTYIISDPYLGGSLNQQIARSEGGKLSVNEAIAYTAELVDALIFLYEKRCIHRDIKSSNCLLDHHGHIKLCDFGSAIIIHSDSNLIKDGPIVGTLHSIAPEVMSSCLPCHDVGYDCISDWWGLGTVVWEMVIGTIPDWNRSLNNLSKDVRRVLWDEFVSSHGGTLPDMQYNDERSSEEYEWHVDVGQQLLAWWASKLPSSSSSSSSSSSEICYYNKEFLKCIQETWHLPDDFLLSIPASSACSHWTAERLMQFKIFDLERKQLAEAKQFISDLLIVDPTQRLNGCHRREDLLTHRFFQSAVSGARRVDWSIVRQNLGNKGLENMGLLEKGVCVDDSHEGCRREGSREREVEEEETLSAEQQQLFQAF
eukprot:CAMPEP_0170068326 /NCGR_PEP_ID=MMETSP0019_2-20121128/7338_1 /TAXON_ID=98059 /ORGANISM="Dinobryon sp., Strain UTEXLB2267" /LENGTH=392 /DNA_ID=CAMNT_0010275933 /DNA_START=1770 /DNA_END=2948 /DNA_ORIENTATION=+